MWFAAGVVPGCLAVAVINRYLYGSALESGYGPVMIFTWERALTNLQRYPKWLVHLQSPAALLAFAAPFVGRWPNIEDGAEHDARVMSLWMLVFCGVVLLCYLFYTPFKPDEWPFLRFMLPAIPVLLILAGHVAVSSIARVPLEDWERNYFRSLFAARSSVGRVDWPPAIE